MSERDFREARESDTSIGDVVDSAVRKIVTALVIAGALIGLGVYSQAGPPRYQIIAAEGRVFRVNTKSGTVIACEGERCAIVLRPGQDFEDHLSPPPAPAPRQIAPPPQAAPAPAPAATPAPAPR